jgi:hypothetical protein
VAAAPEREMVENGGFVWIYRYFCRGNSKRVKKVRCVEKCKALFRLI